MVLAKLSFQVSKWKLSYQECQSRLSKTSGVRFQKLKAEKLTGRLFWFSRISF